jgi:hypothetical protein
VSVKCPPGGVIRRQGLELPESGAIWKSDREDATSLEVKGVSLLEYTVKDA